MSLFLQVLQIVAPVFILAGIGFFWVRAGWEYKVQFVTRLSMTLSVPCLIFSALSKTQIEPELLGIIAAASAAAYFAIAVAFYLALRLAKLSFRTFLAPMILGNTGNLGLPLALFAFGSAGLDYAVVVFAIMSVFGYSAGVWLVSGSGSPIAAFREPIVWATLLGGLFLVQGWSLPVWTMNTIDLLGQIAIPVMLITLGVAISRLHPKAILQALALSSTKFLVCLGAAVAAGMFFKLPPVAFAVLVMQLTTPVAVTSYMLAEKYDANGEAVAGLVVVSTLLSVATIPITLAFLI